MNLQKEFEEQEKRLAYLDAAKTEYNPLYVKWLESKINTVDLIQEDIPNDIAKIINENFNKLM